MPGIAHPQDRIASLLDADFMRIAALVHGIAGIVLPENKRPLVQSRLMRRLQALGLDSFSAYADFVSQKGNEVERAELLTAVTTNVTAFFREQHHFDKLLNTILPTLSEKARAGGRVRIWSAGCSSGEEPYSIASCVLAAIPEAGRLDVRILATDIDQSMIARVQTAKYSTEAVAAVPADQTQKLFGPAREGGFVQISDAARHLVRAKLLNLQDNWPMSGTFDAIFCRNVVIYFDKITQERLWLRFAQLLPPGGSLMIGHSERVTGDALSKFVVDGVTTYKRH